MCSSQSLITAQLKNKGVIKIEQKSNKNSKNPSPFRFPGGKSKLSPFVSLLIEKQNLNNCTYVEPFAGGGGVALSLLFDNKVSKIILNDSDVAIYSAWRAMLTDTDSFIKLILNTPITVEEWRKQKEVYRHQNQEYSLELGFATFFLNRTNRSGILNAGVIGGLSQEGKYKINSRYNSQALVAKIQKISQKREQIELFNEDFERFLAKIQSKIDKNAFFFLDPPYYQKGKELYKNYFTDADHIRLAKILKELNYPWILTYDNADFIKSLYKDTNCKPFSLRYSAANHEKATELMFFNKNLNFPTENELKNAKIKLFS